MSKHSQPRTGPAPGLGLAALGGGAVLTGAAWVYLVGAAVDFGVLAVRGEGGLAWVFTLGASFGAVVCLALMLILVARALRELGYVSDYTPRRAAERPARRRAGGRSTDAGGSDQTRSLMSEPSTPSDSRAQ